MAEASGDFLANFETGQATEAGTLVVEAGNSLTAIADAAAHGVYGARCLFGGTNNDCYAWTSFTARGTECCRLYFRFNADFSCPDTTGLYLLGFRSGTSWRYYIQFRVVSGAITIYRLYYYTESGVAYISAGSVAVTKGDWHYIQVDVLSTASGAGVSDGEIRYYFDNEEERAGWWKSDVPNYGVTFDRLYSGMSGTAVPTNGSYVDIDDLKMDSSHIGAYLDDMPIVYGDVSQESPSGSQSGEGFVFDNTGSLDGEVAQEGEVSDQEISGQIYDAVPLIIDHTSVELYASIPESFKTSIKQKWLSVPGESHSGAYRVGLDLLEALDASFAVNVTESGTPEMPTSDHLRASRATWGNIDNPTGWIYYYGEEDWWTSALAIARTKAFIQYAYDNGFELSALGFGWCWDATWHNDPTATKDPVYKCGWAGSSVGGPEGDLQWGLDAEDSAITGNSVCLDTYLDATQQYVDYCEEHSIPTKVFFTTGAIDNLANTENSYQRYLKYERIRAYVNTYGGVLFDYADILCWDDAGNQRITSWTDGEGTVHQMPHMALDNFLNLDGSDGSGNTYHIGERGALRLGKAIWVMLAMMDGWDGTPMVEGDIEQESQASDQESVGSVVDPLAIITGAVSQASIASHQSGVGEIVLVLEFDVTLAGGAGHQTIYGMVTDPLEEINGTISQGGQPSVIDTLGAVLQIPPALITIGVAEGPCFSVSVSEGGSTMSNASPIMLDAIEELSTKAVVVSFSYINGGAAVDTAPKTLTWSLRDLNDAVVNGRENVPISVIGTSVSIVLSGEDLNIDGSGELRKLVIRGTYDSELGNDLPFTKEIRFPVLKVSGL